MWNLKFHCSQRKLGWLRIPKLAYACGSSWDSNSALQKHPLEVFHQVLSGRFQFGIKLLDKHIPKYVTCLRNLSGWNWQKCDLQRFFSKAKIVFFIGTGWISTIKISKDSFNFSKSDSKKYAWFITLPRRPGKSIMPRILEISGVIDVCGKPLKIRLETVFSFFNCLQKSNKIL